MSGLARLSSVVLSADSSRTVIRPFSVEDPGAFSVKDHPRSQRIIERIKALDDVDFEREVRLVLSSLKERHRNVEELLLRRFDEIEGLEPSSFSRSQKLLIGAYFSEEFSFESAALFNPSVVVHPDQSGVAAGDLRIVLSLRGIGEGHVSSLTFRTAVWAADGSVTVDTPSNRAVAPTRTTAEGANGELIVHLACDGAVEISETVIYPFMPSQGRGIEDVRLVPFTEDDGTVDYRGTFTAFNGSDVRQGMLRTTDFKNFEMRGVQGSMYDGKGMALFPRRINGRFFMLGRQDNESVWLLSSDDLYTWNGGQKILSPEFPWEFIQMGNCGSPVEIDEGWLVFTHGVGVVRNYCVGASLLAKDDPSKVLGRLKRPLLEPSEKWRDGYVPNVVYSCGALVRDRTVLLPYGVADSFTSFATVGLNELLGAMTSP